MLKHRNFMRAVMTVVITVLIMNVVVFAEVADNSRIEIKFTVGDSTLKINDKDVTVETPYVVDGTTLVPLRVITEAFGVDVSWNEETKGITLVYEDVIIKLNIDKTIAYINSQITQLLQAPQLTNGTTMVPLRFVTENFGADVSYDEVTDEITVVKVNIDSIIKDFALILKRTTKEFVGDSYYKWYMPIPKEMNLANRTFDGYNSFFVSDDQKKSILVMLYSVDNTVTIDTVGSTLVEYAKDNTLIENVKKVDSKGREYYFVKYRNKESTFECKGYLKNGVVFHAISSVTNEVPNIEKQVISDIMSGFILDFKNDDTIEDLSDITEDGYRIFEDNKMKLSLKVPADWFGGSSENKDNEYYFSKYSDKKFVGSISLAVYSNDGYESIEQLAKRDYSSNLDTINPKCVTSATPVEPIDVNGTKGFFYTITTNDGKSTVVMNDIFVTNKGYRYNLTIRLSEITMTTTEYYNDILKSFKFDELDAEEVGKLIRYEKNDENFTNYKNEAMKFSIDKPTTWERGNSDSIFFYDNESTRSFYVAINSNDDYSSLNNITDNYMNYLKNQNATTVESSKRVKVNGYDMFLIKIVRTDETDSKYVFYEYIYTKDKKIYNISFCTSYFSDGKKTELLFEKIINTFKIIS